MSRGRVPGGAEPCPAADSPSAWRLRLRTLPILLFSLLVAATPSAGANRLDLTLGKAAGDENCSLAQVGTTYGPGDRQVFARVLLRAARPADHLRLEWVSPAGEVMQDAEYSDLPAARRLCLMSQLSVAGFSPASQPGRWTVRVLLDGRVQLEKRFAITGTSAIVSVSEVAIATAPDGRLRIDLTGTGFEPNSVVHIAQYTQSAAWQYFAAELPPDVAPNRISFRTAPLLPGEYVVVVGTPQGALSQPNRFLISTGRNYKLPTPAGERWIVTQGPYGSFSHWNRSLHAWDIAPQGGRSVVAMRSGTVDAHDLGMARTPGRRSFGNFITVDHGDGEYSHYAHLKTGSFLVRTGQHVEQGQPLAIAGNSGYSLGPGGGYHVHVHVTRSPVISAQSIPFSFEDLAYEGTRGFRGPVVSANLFAAGRTAGEARANNRTAQQPGQVLKGSVQPAEWWSGLVAVPARSSEFDVELSWADASAELDLHLVSPSGKHYGWYGERSGYSGQRTRPEKFAISLPEAGPWRVSVQGMYGAAGPTAFEIQARATPAPRRARQRMALRHQAAVHSAAAGF